MNTLPALSRSIQLLSDPVVLSSLESLARTLGVRPSEVEAVVHDARRTAIGAIAQAERSTPPFGADFEEMADPGGPEPIPVPPADPVGFVCWLHAIAGRKAVRRARPAWIEAWQGASGDGSGAEWNGLKADGSDGRRSAAAGAMLDAARELARPDREAER